MKLTDKDVAQIKAEIARQKEPSRPKKLVSKKLRKMVPVRYQSDYISAGQRPKVLLGEHYSKTKTGVVIKRTDDAFNYHHRTGRTARGGTPKGVGLSGDKPTPKEFKDTWQQDSNSRDAISEYYRVWANKVGSKHGVDQFHKLRVSASWVLWFFASEYFWEQELEDGSIRRSMIYRNKDQAYHAKDFDYVSWIS